jgi:hypothetical protein
MKTANHKLRPVALAIVAGWSLQSSPVDSNAGTVMLKKQNQKPPPDKIP